MIFKWEELCSVNQNKIRCQRRFKSQTVSCKNHNLKLKKSQIIRSRYDFNSILYDYAAKNRFHDLIHRMPEELGLKFIMSVKKKNPK